MPIKVQKKVPRNQVKAKARIQVKEPSQTKAQVKKKVPINKLINKESGKLVSAQQSAQKTSSKVEKSDIMLASVKKTKKQERPSKLGVKSQAKSDSPQNSARNREEASGREAKFSSSMDLVRESLIANLRESLLNQKTLILNKSRSIEEEALMSPSDGVQDEADQASRQLSLNLSLNLHERDRSSLFLIEKALSRIQNGSYGHCDLCGIEIGLRRLQARPFASLCIDCMQDQEDLRPNSSPS